MRTYGAWGSRIPLGNLLVSKGIGAALRWRKYSRRVINELKSRSSPAVVATNDEGTGLAMRQWLESGYEKLNIGGGRKNLEGFVNVDFMAYPGVERAVRANILDLAFIPDSVIAHVHTNHVLEHLHEPDIVHQLREYRRIMKPGAILTLRCPNALGVAYGFWFPPVIESDREGFQRLGFPVEEDLANPADAWFHRDFYAVLHWFFGDAGNVANEHLTVLTPTKIQHLLADAGFSVLKMAEPEAVNIVVVARSM